MSQKSQDFDMGWFFVQYCHHGSKELPVYINTLLETNVTVSDQFLRLVSEPMLKNINIVCTKKGE